MTAHFFQRRSIWWPTRLGWLVAVLAFLVPIVTWCLFAEKWLALTERQPADVLIVEGWIGFEGIRAARVEFEKGGYRLLVTTGAQTNNRWTSQRWNYATEAAELLLREGMPADKVIAAPAPDTGSHRTFEAARAAANAAKERGIHPTAVNIFTLGVHARRSRVVFAKVLPAEIPVGVIAWIPRDYHADQRWWQSSERALDLIKESLGYVFELLLNSGRGPNSPPAKHT